MLRGRPLRAGGFQKSLALKLEKLEEAHPDAEVQLWAEDETRLGLKPVSSRRVWAPIGKRPTARFKRGYEWTYLYGFLRPESGEVFWMILPTVNTELFSLALGEFAKEVGAGTDKHILLWSWTKPDGTPEGRWSYPKACIWSCFPLVHRSYNPRRGCGR